MFFFKESAPLEKQTGSQKFISLYKRGRGKTYRCTQRLLTRCFSSQGVCTEAGMYALRERRVHVTQEDFELAVAKVSITLHLDNAAKMSANTADPG